MIWLMVSFYNYQDTSKPRKQNREEDRKHNEQKSGEIWEPTDFQKRKTRTTMRLPTLLLDKNFLIFFDSRTKAINSWDRLRNVVLGQATVTYREKMRIQRLHMGEERSQVRPKPFVIGSDSWLKMFCYTLRICVLVYYFFYIQEMLAFTTEYYNLEFYNSWSMIADFILFVDLVFDYTLYAYVDSFENVIEDRKQIREVMFKNHKTKLIFKFLICLPLYLIHEKLYFGKLLVGIHFRSVYVFGRKISRSVVSILCRLFEACGGLKRQLSC